MVSERDGRKFGMSSAQIPRPDHGWRMERNKSVIILHFTISGGCVVVTRGNRFARLVVSRLFAFSPSPLLQCILPSYSSVLQTDGGSVLGQLINAIVSPEGPRQV